MKYKSFLLLHQTARLTSTQVTIYKTDEARESNDCFLLQLNAIDNYKFSLTRTQIVRSIPNTSSYASKIYQDGIHLYKFSKTDAG